jgi:hypothetical protein
VNSKETEFLLEINNFAFDRKQDMVIVNMPITELQNIRAHQVAEDLKINIHAGCILVKQWFLGESYQHLTVKSNDYEFALVPPSNNIANSLVMPIAIYQSASESRVDLHHTSSILRTF